ncbi:hypothetical protein ACQKNB_14685 [Lysinibacillus xylanilyticus]|uniref:hypothetical protein n=1 Tax=Lysinibacillus xylanilyticus TaxID=582475 RepID=UPI003CFEC1C9
MYNKLIGVETGRLLGDCNRGTKAKTITSCDNAFVTNILLLLSLRCTTLSHRQKHFAAATLALRFRAKNICWPETLQRSEAAHRTPPGSSALCESEASAMFYLCESATAATTKRPAGTEINHTLW